MSESGESRRSSLDDAMDSGEGSLLNQGNENSSEVGSIDPLNDILLRMKPLLKAEESIARDCLKSLGVENISHMVSVVKEGDVKDIISHVKFRLFVKQLKEGAKSKKHATATIGGYYLNISHIVSNKLHILMKGPDVLSQQDWKAVVDAVADDIEDNMSVVREDAVKKVAWSLIIAYSKAFGCITCDEEEKTHAVANLTCSLLNRVNYKRRKCDKRGSKRKRPRFSTPEEYALQPEKDNPVLSADVSIKDLQTKRSSLIRMFDADEYSIDIVRRMMVETVVLQRNDINQKLNMLELKKRWPFIGQTDVLLDHFFSLMSIDHSEVDRNLEAVLPKYIKFFEFLSTKRRKGDAKEIPEKIRRILKVYHENKQTNKRLDLVAVVLCLIRHLQLPKKEIFLHFDDTANVNEIQDSNLPDTGYPRIAILGSSYFSEGTMAHVMVDNVILWEEPVPLIKALQILFMVHFVFKVAYNPYVGPLMEFMQRMIYNIREEGTRVARKKSKKGNYCHAVKTITSKYSTFMKNYRVFTSKYLYE